jgi:transcriptional regulator with XRE-family HTH domain|tara:strand:- start:82 stop:369 length:288 start_codon:yes stop_codon:yes gene_type:complete
MGFGEWICKAVHRHGMTHRAFEDVTGVSRGSLYRWRINGQLPRLELFVQVCEVLARLGGRSLEDVMLDGLRSVPDYGYALVRLAQVQHLLEVDDA